ncbi:MAG: PolC-type DNA polymerase III [Acholeplasmatales bacterium]|nr:PolC-type DNA polymerase III [Acholeplasmatales bacterium]
MKIKDEIEQSGVLNGNSISDISCVLKVQSRKININVVIENALSLSNYNALCNHIRTYLRKLECMVSVDVSYLNMTLNEEELKEYTTCILESLEESSPRFKALSAEEPVIAGDSVSFVVAYDAKGLDDLLIPIDKEFQAYGLKIKTSLKYDESSSIEAQIKTLEHKMDVELANQAREAEEFEKANKTLREENNKQRSFRPTEVTPIKNIPMTHEQLVQFMNENGKLRFWLQGYTFGESEVKTFAKGKSAGLLTLKMTDETDSIVVKKWLSTEAEKETFEAQLKGSKDIRVIGEIKYDDYAKMIIVQANSIEILGNHKQDLVKDESSEKRVELHLHTKMSALDGVTDAKDYVKAASSWGWRGLALTDLNGVYAIPDIEHAIADLGDAGKDFKPIYGTELAYVDDSKYFITFDKRDIDLKTATYVVYDIETTGLSQTYDDIIEIAAHKVKGGLIIDEYEVFVNPKRHISEKITSLTSITDDMVKDAKTIDQILPEFFEFCKDSILVAHNAKFDVGMIYAKVKKCGLDFPVLPVIDTLNLFRAGYGDQVKTFNLKTLSKFFKVKQEQHHRATDDTRVTALCFIQMLNDLYAKNIFNYGDINSLIDPNEHWKYLISKESHITFLVKNKAGNKNLYKLVSDALTVHLYKGDAKALRSVIEQYREGLLVGTSSANGEVFTLAATRSEEETLEAMKFYDYIEVSPPSCYYHMYDNYDNGGEAIREIIQKIIRLAKSIGKPVVATSDCYYLRPSDKHYREILIASPKLGGGTHDLANAKIIPNNHLRTTTEMMDEFNFLDPQTAHEIVIDNPNAILDQIEKFNAFSPDMFAPRDDQFKDNPVVNYVQSINEESRRIVYDHVKGTYGDNPHPIIVKRVERELNSIIKSGYMSVYYISHLLVKKSLDDGYLVGSRGSVGSSLVATMMDITEVNPLKPHYVCKKCHFHTLKMSAEEQAEYPLSDIEKPFQETLQSVDSGFDLPDMVCPCCGNRLSKNGQDIPFETFLGFEGDKTPDIDLNFSGEYQGKAHEYIRTVFGNDHAFRGGTVATIAEKVGYGYVKGYCEKKGITLRDCEIDRLATHLDGVRRSTGQHPGGIVVVPNYVDIYDVTPFQFPADDTSSIWRTTHYDYHKFEANLLKFDILGHDDPTIIRYLMNYVNAHQDEFPFERAQDIPIDDPKLYQLFANTEVIGLRKEDLGCEVASYGVPEFGTNFVQRMLIETKPQTFAQLIKISGLSHGTDVWSTNAQDLVNGKTEYGVIPFKDVIGCRDDIMVDLMRMGLAPKDSFDIMEFVRKGKLYKGGKDKWEKYVGKMHDAKIPDWYIFSCSKIKYMFPKAHAIAYVMMALRIAWFKVYYPKLFYSAWLSKRAKGYNVQAFLGGPMAIRAKIEEIKSKGSTTATEDDLVTALQIALEMTLRGIKFLPVDINKSSATTFEIEGDDLRIPFAAVDKLGESVALNIVAAREEREFTSIADACKRGKINNSLADVFRENHFFGNLPEEDAEKTEGLFAFI